MDSRRVKKGDKPAWRKVFANALGHVLEREVGVLTRNATRSKNAD